MAADTPLLPVLAQREVVIRFPKYTRYSDRQGAYQSVDWVVAFLGYYPPLAALLKRERNQQRLIRRELKALHRSSRYLLVHFQGGTVVLRRAADTASDRSSSAGKTSSCRWLD